MTNSKMVDLTDIKPEILDEWVRRLRSGDYLQARGTFYDVIERGAPSHCCLSVLTTVACDQGLVDETAHYDGDGVFRVYDVETHCWSEHGGTLPTVVAEVIMRPESVDLLRVDAYGVAGDLPGQVEVNLGTPGEPQLASAINDEDEADFDEIADMIERNRPASHPGL